MYNKVELINYSGAAEQMALFIQNRIRPLGYGEFHTFQWYVIEPQHYYAFIKNIMENAYRCGEIREDFYIKLDILPGLYLVGVYANDFNEPKKNLDTIGKTACFILTTVLSEEYRDTVQIIIHEAQNIIRRIYGHISKIVIQTNAANKTAVTDNK